MQKNRSNQIELAQLMKIALISAISLVLSYIPLGNLTAGIDLSLGIIPIAFLALKEGTISAVSAGFLTGIMSIIVGKAYFLTAWQVIIEFPIAFASFGLIGIFRQKILNEQRTFFWVMISAFIGVFSRWFWHFLAGVIFWGNYTPQNISPIVYSLTMNGISALVNMALVTILMVICLRKNLFAD